MFGDSNVIKENKKKGRGEGILPVAVYCKVR
jgi:hypothetical protein